MKQEKSRIAETKTQLTKEAKKTTKMLRGKVVRQVWRHCPGEIGIEFEDGTRLFADIFKTGLELSVTKGTDERD